MAVITISRQFGAGGKTLAQKLAKSLNYTIVHDEIIEKLAQKFKLTPDGVRAYETEVHQDLAPDSDLLSPKRFLDYIIDPHKKYMDAKEYESLLKKIIPDIAEKDKVIILGRGSQFILKDRPHTCHLLLVASLADRIRFVQEKYNLSPSDAEKIVNRQSKRRMKLMKVFHHEDFDQPLHYDLVLNMSKLDMDAAVETVCIMVP